MSEGTLVHSKPKPCSKPK